MIFPSSRSKAKTTIICVGAFPNHPITGTQRKMPYLTKRIGFSAAHHYWNPSFSEDENRRVFHACANRHGHGHNYLVEVTLAGPVHPETGMIVNFFDLDPILETHIVNVLDHKHLNHEVPFFAERIPTLENIALFICNTLEVPLQTVELSLHHLRVIEASNLFVDIAGSHQMPQLTRRYTFSAAHRLWNPAFSDDENRQHFGACVNLHGHNYTLDVTIEGEPHVQTGMIIDIVLLDRLVKETLLDAVDHKYLDEDVPFLHGRLSTVENTAQVFLQKLQPVLAPYAHLSKIRLYESDTNWTEVLASESETLHV